MASWMGLSSSSQSGVGSGHCSARVRPRRTEVSIPPRGSPLIPYPHPAAQPPVASTQTRALRLWSPFLSRSTIASPLQETRMPNLQSVLRQEIQRLARREVRSGLEATKKTVTQHRREIAELKRRNTALERAVSYLQSRETKRLKAGPSEAEPPKGTRFSFRSSESSAEEVGTVPGGLRGPRRRQRLYDLQLGEWEYQAEREALGDVGVP